MFDFQRILWLSASVYLHLLFRSMYKGPHLVFIVLAIDQKGNETFFNMEQREKMWKIINAPRVPDSILAKEYQLSLLINEFQDGTNEQKLIA